MILGVLRQLSVCTISRAICAACFPATLARAKTRRRDHEATRATPEPPLAQRARPRVPLGFANAPAMEPRMEKIERSGFGGIINLVVEPSTCSITRCLHLLPPWAPIVPTGPESMLPRLSRKGPPQTSMSPPKSIRL